MIVKNEISSFLVNYGWLAKNAMKEKKLNYSVAQKHHLLAHLPEMAKGLAPRHYWCYGSKSFMGLCVRLAASCAYGTPGYKAPGRESSPSIGVRRA